MDNQEVESLQKSIKDILIMLDDFVASMEKLNERISELEARHNRITQGTRGGRL